MGGWRLAGAPSPTDNAPSMHILRNAHHLARLLLACFAVSLGVATAAPFVQAGHLERVCTASGEERWVAAGGNSAVGTNDASHPTHALDCALCLPPLLPALDAPPWRGLQQLSHVPSADVVRQTHVPALSRAPFPPRAPPAAPLALAPF